MYGFCLHTSTYIWPKNQTNSVASGCICSIRERLGFCVDIQIDLRESVFSTYVETNKRYNQRNKAMALFICSCRRFWVSFCLQPLCANGCFQSCPMVSSDRKRIGTKTLFLENLIMFAFWIIPNRKGYPKRCLLFSKNKEVTHMCRLENNKIALVNQ